MSANISTRIRELLDRDGAPFRCVTHPPEGRSELVAAQRGTTVRQGAKALLCAISGAQRTADHVLAVLSGADRADMKRIGKHFGGKNARFADAATVEAITGCSPGAVPPFPLDDDLPLVADAGFLAEHTEIAFNAGRLDTSIIMPASDYIRLFRPQQAPIAQ